MGASYALVDDPEARDYRRFQQTRAGGTKNPYKLPPPADNFTHSPLPVNTPQPRVESYVPPEPKGTTTSPNAESALPDATPTPADAIIDVQPSELPDLPSSRTRSKTKTIESVGATLIAAALRDTSSDGIVVLFDEMQGNDQPQINLKTHNDAVALEDADAWIAAECKELRNHQVHRTFSQIDRSSMEAGKRTPPNSSRCSGSKNEAQWHQEGAPRRRGVRSTSGHRF